MSNKAEREPLISDGNAVYFVKDNSLREPDAEFFEWLRKVRHL